jgi:hypothetical protein
VQPQKITTLQDYSTPGRDFDGGRRRTAHGLMRLQYPAASFVYICGG